MKFRILVLLSVLLPFLVSAEEKQSAFRSLNADDGLTHNAVLAILQDRMGFMWFGTKDGLNRYDGTEIRIIAVEDAIPGNNYITTLCEDGDGCIWMGTDAGVCIYDPGTERARIAFLNEAMTAARFQVTLRTSSWLPTAQYGSAVGIRVSSAMIPQYGN